MKYRAIILDIYRTVIRVGEYRTDIGGQWTDLYQSFFHALPAMDFQGFNAACQAQVRQQQAIAMRQGIVNPEVWWEGVVMEALPELKRLKVQEKDEFIYRHIQLLRPIELMPGAAEALSSWKKRGLLLGVASNAQPYTLRELKTVFANSRFQVEELDRDLQCWSFENGFSKPNPHVFRILTACLMNRGIQPEEILMVGDRVDNDMRPAADQGWNTWLLNVQSAETWNPSGDWNALQRHVEKMMDVTQT